MNLLEQWNQTIPASSSISLLQNSASSTMTASVLVNSGGPLSIQYGNPLQTVVIPNNVRSYLTIAGGTEMRASTTSSAISVTIGLYG